MIRHGEDYQIEYKEAKRELPQDLFDTVCSFSNREGGDIFLGVLDAGVITGVEPEAVPKLITDFATLVNNKNKLFPPLYLTAIPYCYDSDGCFVGNQAGQADAGETGAVPCAAHPCAGGRNRCAA